MSVGRAFDFHEVGAKRTADNRFRHVRIANVGVDAAGFRIDFGVRRTDAFDERPQIAVERATEVTGRTDADVTGEVDCPTPGGGHVEGVHAIRVGDGVGPGPTGRDVDADANPREALL